MNNIAAQLNSNDYQWGYTENPIPLSFFSFKKWQQQGLAGPLKYLTDARGDLRQDLRLIYPEFKSALVFLFPYGADVSLLQELYRRPDWNGLKLAGYSFSFGGHDYHKVLGSRLEVVAKQLTLGHPDLTYRISVDTLPLLERDLAYRAGLGFYGVNSMLINRSYGSFFMIGAILLNKTLPLDPPVISAKDCGQCGKCAPACPAKAIDTFAVDASRCYSTFSIETFVEATIPIGFAQQKRFFGCDICQEVCPWNQKVLQQASIKPLSDVQQYLADFWLLRPLGDIISDLQGMSNSSYQKKFAHTSFARTGRKGLLKNLIALS